MKSPEELKEKWSVLLNSTTDSDCRAMLIEPMETKIVKPQMKLTELTEEEKLKINELTERTGEPRMECIKALSQCDWNVDQSIGWLNTRTFKSYI